MPKSYSSNAKKVNLVVRLMERDDIRGVVALSRKVYDAAAMTEEMIAGQFARFPQGQFVATYNDEIVGHCATFIIAEALAKKTHSWMEICGQGFASRHDDTGDFLYGMEVCVDPDYRRLRIGQRLYDARKQLCIDLGLKGIVFGGRMPGLRRRIKNFITAQAYLDAALEGQIKDPVIEFQQRNGFEVVGLLPAYLPDDDDSLGYATHMVWNNPLIDQATSEPVADRGQAHFSVRIASVQYQVRKVSSFEDFAKQVEYFVDVAADYRSDFVVFPELFTIPLLSIEKQRLSPQESIEKITQYTDDYVTLMQHMAVSYNINIVGGSHPAMTERGDVENQAFVFLRDGQVFMQPKLHPTPNEAYWWNIKGGNKLRAIPTDCGPVGVLVCYDSEFPEASRYLTDQGIKILFVPYCTDERQGHLRVRYCCQARAVENQIYVVTSGVVGNLPDVENMDVHYAQSGIYTPCDFPFARDGIAAIADANTEAVIFADLDLEQLTMSRNSGTVQNLKDRRYDLYHVAWKAKD